MGQSDSPPSGIGCAARLELIALPGIPVVSTGDDLPALIEAALGRAGLALAGGDVVVVTSKVVSRSEGRFVDLGGVAPSERARELAAEIGKDPRFVECVLGESTAVSRVVRGGALVVRHRLGFLCANAGIDASNARPSSPESSSENPPAAGPWVLLLPRDPDASAERIRAALSARSGAAIGVVITDSLGRPFRLGTVGSAIGIAGVPALWDQRGDHDLFGKTLEITVTALGDQIAAAADLVAGQADEARPVVVVRGLSFPVGAHAAGELYRPPDEDVYA
jgi:coenzyme F420-0:L-glutamate ligase/coenzyme F420-1:gamma-L-glutamate ligase